jgi:hypothetical protein
MKSVLAHVHGSHPMCVRGLCRSCVKMVVRNHSPFQINNDLFITFIQLLHNL